MADEDITLDGKPLQSLRVADLKAALEQRNLPKSGQKNTLIKRLKGALMLENLQKSSSSHSGLQPNSQIGEEMSQNSFIKQYLAKQQELLRQRLEREAQQDDEAEESPAVPEEDDDHSDENDSSFVSDKRRSMPSQPAMTRDDKAAGDTMMGHAMMACAASMDPSAALHPQESFEAPGAWMQRAAFLQGHKEPQAPSPPRAVASLSVRILGQPDRQGLPPAIPRAQEKEGTAPSEPGSAHSVLHLSRSAAAAAGSRPHVEDDDDDSGDDESEDDDDWGPGPGGVRRGNRAPPQPQQMPQSFPARSKRKLQPPQHIPPPQVHHTPMQLRHPTPPPSPPPDLFPLPDTPKQSPPDAEDQERGPRVRTFPPPNLQRQDSDSSSRSSSPEPPMKRKPGPLSMLVHKMETEGAFASAAGVSGESAHSTAGPACSSDSPLQRPDRRRLEEEKEREKQEEQERERRKIQETEKERKRLEEEKEKERKRLEEEEKQRQKEELQKERKRQEEEKQRVKEEREKERKRQEEEKEKERKRQEEEKRKEQQKRQETAHKGRVAVTEAQDSSSDSDSSSRSSRSSSSSGEKNRSLKQLKKVDQGRGGEDEKKPVLGKEAEKRHLSKREVSEPSAAAVTEVEPDSESSMAQQPPSGAEPESSEGQLEEVPMPLPLPLMVPAAYYYYHQHQHLLHSSSYSSYNSCLAMPKCAAVT